MAADVVSLSFLKEGLAIGTHAPYSYDEIGRNAGFRSIFHRKEAITCLDPKDIINLDSGRGVIERVADSGIRLSQIVIRDQLDVVPLQQFASCRGGQDLQLLLSRFAEPAGLLRRRDAARVLQHEDTTR